MTKNDQELAAEHSEAEVVREELDDILRDGDVGIFWFYMQEIAAFMIPVGYSRNAGAWEQFGLNHESRWRTDMVRKHPELKIFRFSSLPRGRVDVDDDGNFYIAGTPELIDDPRAQTTIKQAFTLLDKNVKVDHRLDAEFSGKAGPSARVIQRELNLLKS